MREEKEHNEFINLVIKDLAGESSPEERQTLDEYIRSDESRQQAYEDYRKIWEGTYEARDYLQEELDMEWKKLQSVLPKTKSNFTFINIAAIIVLLVVATAGIYFIFDKWGNETVLATSETTRQKMLSDGSSITLNKNSKLVYPQMFKEGKRTVELTGEAFFDVQRSPDRPFIVKTGNVEVEVLGTSFNVQANESGDLVEVTVSTGEVKMSVNSEQAKELMLMPGEMGVYNKKNRTIQKQTKIDPNYLAWKTRKFIFDDVPLSKVVADLNKVYREQIYIESEHLSTCPVTVSFEALPVDAILKILTSTLDAEMQYTEKGIMLKGKGC